MERMARVLPRRLEGGGLSRERRTTLTKRGRTLASDAIDGRALGLRRMVESIAGKEGVYVVEGRCAVGVFL